MSVHDHPLDQTPLADFAVPPPGKMTEAEFVAWCDEDTRAEWVDGEVVMMSPANPEHGILCAWLAGLLGQFVEHHGLGLVAYDVQVSLTIVSRRRAPDILYVAKDHLDRLTETHLEGPPDLIVEVVSPDSEARDWREKYLEYEAGGVREYWVIDPAPQHAEAYALAETVASKGRKAAKNEYRRLNEKQGVIASAVLPGFFVRTAWLWPQTRPKVLDALRQMGLPIGPGQ
jgi:Uma2 family endonuclease